MEALERAAVLARLEDRLHRGVADAANGAQAEADPAFGSGSALRLHSAFGVAPLRANGILSLPNGIPSLPNGILALPNGILALPFALSVGRGVVCRGRSRRASLARRREGAERLPGLVHVRRQDLDPVRARLRDVDDDLVRVRRLG